MQNANVVITENTEHTEHTVHVEMTSRNQPIMIGGTEEGLGTGIQLNNNTTVISEVKSVVSTVVSRNRDGLQMINESNLSEQQRQLAISIHSSVKISIEGLISDPNINNTVKVTKTIGQVIKQLETTHINGMPPSGADKKAVAIQLGRILIKEVVPDDCGEDEILMIYDLVAEPTLEAMIEVSKVVNVVVKHIATKCCPGLMSIFKK